MEKPRLRLLKPERETGRIFVLEPGVLRIGRQQTNDVVLQDTLVSREHAHIRFDGNCAMIEDIGGKNPIRVNGDSVQSHVLRDGDRIIIGQTEMAFEFPNMKPTHSLDVVRDDARFEEGIGGISVDAATVPFERPDLASPAVAEKIYRRLSHLYRFSEELLSVEEEDALYELLIKTATQETGAERGFLGLAPNLFDSNPKSLNVVKFWDPVQGEKAQSIQMSETIFNHIIRQQRAVLVRDVPQRQDFGMSVIGLKIHSFICAPMIHGDRFLGLLYVDTRSQREQFERSDLEFVSALTRLAALALQNLRSQSWLQKENERLRQLGVASEGLIGNHPKMVEILRLIDKVAPRDTSVLIAGENGTGKELIARAIHKRSLRKDKPFIPVNCGAIPPNLVESELFGYEKGAFTGANQTTPGKFELASGGTLFLDEVGDMPIDMQVKILRALQERKYYRVGGKAEIEVDIRVLSATNQDLQRLIEESRFREDLFFRLAVITITVPPLRERGEDLLTLAKHFLEYHSPQGVMISKQAEECLLKYPWPGNIRELRNVLESALILCDGKRITLQDLPQKIAKTTRGQLSFQLKTLAEVEKQYIQRVLEATDGNKVKAAEILKISRETLYQKLKQFGEGNDSKTNG
ncbi:MAG: sigma 54-interacting transcriptional regulator [Planctomycetes bacterium]|nr:sigma 54-interacting transcriptional regulator [Planctomycetota bacterium]